MDLKELLGDEYGYLLEHRATGVSRERLHLPGPDFMDQVVAGADRSPAVLRNLLAATMVGMHGVWLVRQAVTGRAAAGPALVVPHRQPRQ